MKSAFKSDQPWFKDVCLDILSVHARDFKESVLYQAQLAREYYVKDGYQLVDISRALRRVDQIRDVFAQRSGLATGAQLDVGHPCSPIRVDSSI